LFYKSFPLHVAMLRGTTADENGNISFEHESIISEAMAVAQAAKKNGGIVIVQVEYITKNGTMQPKDVKIPGIMVDYVVQATDQRACWQAEGVYYEPAFSGQVKKPLSAIIPLSLDERKVIARRCAMELKKGAVVNLGVGMAVDVANVVSEEGYVDKIVLTTESGAIGGVPSSLPNFGSAYNPEAAIDHGAMFDFIDGGGLDMTCLGLGEADKEGNVNVSKFGARLTGPGGFINITQSTKKVVFCGTFMGKAKLAVGDGRITVVQEGKIKKFLNHVEQITFSGKYAHAGQEIIYVTERCVFRLINGRMTITEIAPGIDLEKDILANMNFQPDISNDLQLMDRRLFCKTWGGLGEVFVV
ncbi:MAG: malonate decarboxylase subunit alpha, partial [Dehalobacterium sp.]